MKLHIQNINLSNDFASESEISLCVKFDKPLLVYSILGNAMK